MNTDAHSFRLFSLSERVYHALLILYPADFRRDYSRYMTQMFRDLSHDAYQHGGTAALATWWAAALFDLLQSIIAEHRKTGFTMSQSKFIQSSGWLFILGGMFFIASSISQLQANASFTSGGIYQLSLYAIIPGMALIMLGLLGIFLRYRAELHVFGTLSLLATLIGAGITAVGWLLTLTGGSSFWNIFILGWMIQLMGQSVFGGFAATTHLLPKWNFTLLIGSGFPLTVIMLGLSGQTAGSGVNLAAFIMLLLIGIGWLLTGWALNNPPVASIQPQSVTAA
ncbi:MAG TPA: hypothetical protein VHL11_16905 [Phototrophicaceae bacterium]|nr:hypothetical protein [Phototrophicaceae bacterium]